jgi:hypothetical protein
MGITTRKVNRSMDSDEFVLDRVENPHPLMLRKALESRRQGGDHWRGFMDAMSAATGEPPDALEAWMDRNS